MMIQNSNNDSLDQREEVVMAQSGEAKNILGQEGLVGPPLLPE